MNKKIFLWIIIIVVFASIIEGIISKNIFGYFIRNLIEGLIFSFGYITCYFLEKKNKEARNK